MVSEEENKRQFALLYNTEFRERPKSEFFIYYTKFRKTFRSVTPPHLPDARFPCSIEKTTSLVYLIAIFWAFAAGNCVRFRQVQIGVLSSRFHTIDYPKGISLGKVPEERVLVRFHYVFNTLSERSGGYNV